MTAAPTADSLTPFRDRGPIPRRPAWKRWLGIADRDAARRALEARLATSAPEVPGASIISALLLAHGVDGRSGRALLVDLFRRALVHMVRDDEIDDAEARYLEQLRAALGISDRELRAIQEEVLHPRFRSEVAAAIADDHLSADDRSRLDRLVARLRLAPETAKWIYEQEGQARIDAALGEAIADGRLSPAEDRALQELARNLGASLTVDDATRRQLDRMRLLWRIDNGELPRLSVPINLQRGEVCHAQAPATWYERRTRTTTVGYSGFSTSVRICKGVRYRVSTVKPTRITREELVQIDAGTVYVTSKRVIFDGYRKNSSLRLSSLLGFTPFADGVQLEKSSGRPPILALSQVDVEIFHATLAAAMANA